MTTTHTATQETGQALVGPGQVAGIAARLAAVAVDQLVVLVAAVMVATVASAAGVGRSGLFVAAGVTVVLVEAAQVFAEAITGATVGGALARVRTVSAHTMLPAGLIAVVVRRLVLVAGGMLVPVVGAYVVAGSGVWSSRATRAGWHDWAGETLVVRDWTLTPVPRHADHGTVAHVDGPAPLPPVDDDDVSTVEVVQDLSHLVPVLDAAEHPRARHRATTLALGRPHRQFPAGRHRIPEVPTQRAPWAATRLVHDDVELTRLSVGDVMSPAMRLVFDCGTRVEVVGNGAVGRDLSGVLPPPAHPVVIDDATRTVSRVHLRFGPQPGRDAVWVVDENSTNGTILIRPDGGARVLPANVRAVIGAGWQIRFGDHAAVVESVSVRPAVNAV
ncbi:MAG: FHA domain-containing protein [Micrococcales bacterium]|nr:FHA domain-containing protein [Micrococcales bacterium]